MYLCRASQRNSIRCVQALIGAGADVNRAGGLMTHHGRYAKGFTPLHYAAFNGHVTVVRLLVEAGANIEARDFWGLTPLHVAAVWAQPTACEVLIELGADELAEDHEGFSPVESADHAYMHYHFESWINETNWLKSPHMSFPGVKVWKECSERIKIAVEDRMSRERLRLEAIGSGRGMMGQIVGMKRMAADSQGRDYPEGKRFRDDGIVENV